MPPGGGEREGWVCRLCQLAIIIKMNKLQISLEARAAADESTWALTYADANRLLPLLRSDHFREIGLSEVAQVAAKDLKFLIQLMRLLAAEVREP